MNWLQRISSLDEGGRDREDFDFDPIVENYGLTSDSSEAGYMLPDGQMLDFSEKQHGGTPGIRSLDHRDVGVFLPQSMSGTEGMLEFMRSSGAVRFGHHGDIMTLDFFDSISSSQARSIGRFIPRLGQILVDIRDSSGRVMNHYNVSGRIDIARLWRSISGLS